MSTAQRWRRWLFGRRTFAAAGIACVALSALAGWHYWVIYDSLSSAQADLLATQSTLRSAVSSGDTEGLGPASVRLDRASGNIHRAQTHINRDPLLAIASHLPMADDNIEGLERTVAIAANLTEAGQEAVIVARELEAVRSADNQGSKVATGIAALDRLEPNLTRIAFLVAESQRERAALGDRDLLPQLQSAVDRVDRELPSLAASIETLTTVQELAPRMLGIDGPRRYLLLALNNGEILPGGGFVTAAGMVEVNAGEIGGEIDFEDSTQWLKAWTAQGGGYIEPPGPLKRYLLRSFPWNLAVANWSPDFPSWSRQAAQFYELVHGPQEADGAVAIDLDVVQKLLTVTGPITVEVAAEGQVTFTPENAVMELERLTRSRPRDPGDRKSVLGDLAPVLIDRIEHLPSEKWPALIEVMQELVAEGHIQVMSLDATEQALLEKAGASGRIETDLGDYLMLNEASVLGTKLALILERSVRHSVDIDPSGAASHTLTYTVRNPLTEWAAGRDAALVKSLMGDGRYGMYLRVFTPASATGFAFEVNGAAASIEDQGLDSGRKWTGIFLPILKDTTAEITIRWTVPAGIQDDEHGYRLAIQQQPGIGELCWQHDVTIAGNATTATIDDEPIVAAAPACYSSGREITVSLPPSESGE